MSYELDNAHDPATGCAGKEAFASMKQATRAAVRINNKMGRGRVKLGAYLCEHCGAHHIGGGSQKVRLIRRIQHGQMMFRRAPRAIVK